MAPYKNSEAPVSTQKIEEKDTYSIDEPTTAGPWKKEYILKNIFFFIYCYIAGLYGLYLCFTAAKWWTIIFSIFSWFASVFGITAGAHRLWTHKAYKATKPLQILLMVFHSLSYQRSIVTWVRDHKLHHKYSDTDADPSNSSRGFFYSHIGWLLVKNHPEMVKRKDLVDMSDIYSNSILMFQKRNAGWFLPLIGMVLPTAIPWMLGETFSVSWHLNMLRYLVNSNLTFLTNSAAHTWGYRPYDTNTKACHSLPVTLVTFGEGFHNYHHTFPWDYRTGELGNNILNHTTTFIDFWARIGWAYDRKTVSEDMIRDRMRRTGDGTDLWGEKIQKDE